MDVSCGGVGGRPREGSTELLGLEVTFSRGLRNMIAVFSYSHIFDIQYSNMLCYRNRVIEIYQTLHVFHRRSRDPLKFALKWSNALEVTGVRVFTSVPGHRNHDYTD